MTALLAFRGLAELDRQRVLSVFRRQNPGPETTYAVEDLQIVVSGNGHPPITLQLEDGAFIAAAGVPIYKAHVGTAAVRELLRDLIANQVDEGEIGGAFAAVGWDGKKARFFTDWLGNMCAYCNDERTVWSTSFLATAASHRRHRLDRQGAWEYIFQGASCGESTVLARIRRIDPEKWHDPMSGEAADRRNLLPREDIEEAPFDDVVDQAVRALSGVFDSIADGYGNRIDTALSGGYDSRLIVAALRARGVSPRVHVYGSSSDSDVVIAKSIASGEGFEIQHTNKGAMGLPLSRERMSEVIERNLFAFDGMPLDGIFDAGADLQTRQERMAGGFLALNGGGGEIFRNFFYLPDHQIALSDLMKTFYSRFDPTVCSDRFNAVEYMHQLTSKVTAALKVEERQVRRVDIERVYPLFRCRYWMAHTTSINNQIGQALTPLVHVPAVAAGLRAPIGYKNYGRLEAAMIKKINPRLAKYASNYRRSTIGSPTISEQLSDYATLMRPIWARKLSYRVGHVLKPMDTYAAWMREFGEHVGDWEHVRDLVSPERIRDIDQLRRVSTLQALCNHFDVESDANH